MDIRPLSDTYAVSPQISPDDLPAIAAAGYTTVICNRPDDEVPHELQAEAIRIATEAAGLAFHVHPVTHMTLDGACVAKQDALCAAADGPVLAYCASGTRCSIVWSFGQAGNMPTEEIIAATARQGYDLGGLAPQLDALAKRASQG